MTKQEIEKAIENGESVWVAAWNNVYEFKLKNHTNRFINTNGNEEMYNYTDENGTDRCFPIKALYKSKAAAEHYLHHANVTRTETLPFLTWEKFKKEHYFGFNSINNEWINVYLTNGLEPGKKIITIENATKEEFLANYDLTEENFYKAYDECVRLFKGEL